MWRKTAFHFPSFSEGLSLRRETLPDSTPRRRKFPFLFGRAFIEAISPRAARFWLFDISLPFRKGFH